MNSKILKQLKESEISKEEMRVFFQEAIVNILGRENIAEEIQNVSGLEINPLDIVYLIDVIF